MGCQRLGCDYYTGKVDVMVVSPVLSGSAAKLPAAGVVQGGEPREVQKRGTRSTAHAMQGSSALGE